MEKFIVAVKVKGRSFITNIEAMSHYGAEHFFLDMAISGHHEYGADGAQAFNVNDTKTEYFNTVMLTSQFVSPSEMANIIIANNERIIKRDEAEDLIRENEKKIKELEEQIAEARKVLSA